MAFLDNTGLERLWQHIVARFVTRDEAQTLTPPENLLDNSNFTNLITYRSEYEESQGDLRFRFDRWRVSPSVVVGSSGIMMSAGNHYFQQGHPLATLKSKKYTAVITLNDGSKYGGTIDLTSTTSASVADGAFTITLTRNYNNTFDRVYIQVALNVIITIASIALYEGEFSILPNYVPKGEIIEHINCLRYFRRIDSNSLTGVTYSNSLQITVPIEIPLRIATPTLIIGDAGAIRAGGEKITIEVNGKEVNASEPSVLSVENSAIVLKISSSYTVSDDELHEVKLPVNGIGVWTGGSVGLDADFA
jgi:hypothetical protein